jgi:hypothetical protein
LHPYLLRDVPPRWHSSASGIPPASVWARDWFGGIVKIIPIHRLTGMCRQSAACRLSFLHSDIFSNTPLQPCQSEAEVSTEFNIWTNERQRQQ